MTDPLDIARLPRSVLVVPDHVYQQLASGADSVDLLQRTDAMVVPHSARPAFLEKEIVQVRRHLDQAGQLLEGLILIKNPFDDDTYEHADRAIAAFAADKYHVMAKVAGLLGAIDVKFEDARIETEASSWAADLATRVKLGKGSASAKREVEKQVTSRIDAHMSFPGGQPSPDAAREYLRDRNLSRDSHLRRLIELREGPHAVLGYEMTVNGLSESESNLRCALDLANVGPVKLLEIGATFARTAKDVKQVNITTRITFSKVE